MLACMHVCIREVVTTSCQHLMVWGTPPPSKWLWGYLPLPGYYKSLVIFSQLGTFLEFSIIGSRWEVVFFFWIKGGKHVGVGLVMAVSTAVWRKLDYRKKIQLTKGTREGREWTERWRATVIAEPLSRAVPEGSFVSGLASCMRL